MKRNLYKESNYRAIVVLIEPSIENVDKDIQRDYMYAKKPVQRELLPRYYTSHWPLDWKCRQIFQENYIHAEKSLYKETY